MHGKVEHIIGSLWYNIFEVVLYGAVLYFVFTWLSGFSLLYAYFGNLALIIGAIALEEWSLSKAKPEWVLQKMAEIKDADKFYRLLKKSLNNNISFRTLLYLFYILILILSPVIEHYPALLGESIGNFILSNNYSILLLIAFDMLIGQITKERERLKKISAELEKAYLEKQD